MKNELPETAAIKETKWEIIILFTLSHYSKSLDCVDGSGNGSA